MNKKVKLRQGFLFHLICDVLQIKNPGSKLEFINCEMHRLEKLNKKGMLDLQVYVNKHSQDKLAAQMLKEKLAILSRLA